MIDGVLIIVCRHIINKEAKGLWSLDQEVLMCSDCWNKFHQLVKKYRGQDNIPIEELDFVVSVCPSCVRKLTEELCQ